MRAVGGHNPSAQPEAESAIHVRATPPDRELQRGGALVLAGDSSVRPFSGVPNTGSSGPVWATGSISAPSSDCSRRRECLSAGVGVTSG